MKENLIRKVTDTFRKLYEGSPVIVSSPGRINVLGEHIDYHGGTVLPASIDKRMILAMAANGKDQIRLFSLDFHQEKNISLHDLKPSQAWSDYIIGVCSELLKLDLKIGGFDLVFSGDIPMGSGMSSSAALECGVAIGLNEIFGLDLDKFRLAKIAQNAENNFVGVQCGSMDQCASVFGIENQILQLNCRNDRISYHDLDLSGHTFVLCNSKVTHELSASDGYNIRRTQSEAGLKVLKARYDIDYLTDATLEMLESVKQQLDEVSLRRCQYVIEEQQRVIAAISAIKNHDLDLLGQLMYQTHEGLKGLYEVSCNELDFLVDTTRNNPSVLGSRMMGGGFGGCTLNLIESDHQSDFVESISKAYCQEFEREPEIYKVSISDGGMIVNGQTEFQPAPGIKLERISKDLGI